MKISTIWRHTLFTEKFHRRGSSQVALSILLLVFSGCASMPADKKHRANSTRSTMVRGSRCMKHAEKRLPCKRRSVGATRRIASGIPTRRYTSM